MLKRICQLAHVIIGLMIVVDANASTLEKLYIFYPTTSDPLSVHSNLTTAIQDIDITYFGSYDEFINKARLEPPDAVITKTAIIHDQLSDYIVSLKGERNGSTEEKYVILTIDKPFKIDSVKTETVIGVLDILGRNGMKSFVKQFFPVEPKLKRAKKIGDLLPMVSLNMADGIMIEDVFADYFKAISQLEIIITPVTGGNNGIVALAVKKDRNTEKILTILKQNNKTISELFYIEKWKTVD